MAALSPVGRSGGSGTGGARGVGFEDIGGLVGRHKRVGNGLTGATISAEGCGMHAERERERAYVAAEPV